MNGGERMSKKDGPLLHHEQFHFAVVLICHLVEWLRCPLQLLHGLGAQFFLKHNLQIKNKANSQMVIFGTFILPFCGTAKCQHLSSYFNNQFQKNTALIIYLLQTFIYPTFKHLI